jgi:hypothetical protein
LGVSWATAGNPIPRQPLFLYQSAQPNLPLSPGPPQLHRYPSQNREREKPKPDHLIISSRVAPRRCRNSSINSQIRAVPPTHRRPPVQLLPRLRAFRSDWEWQVYAPSDHRVDRRRSKRCLSICSWPFIVGSPDNSSNSHTFPCTYTPPRSNAASDDRRSPLLDRCRIPREPARFLLRSTPAVCD